MSIQHPTMTARQGWRRRRALSEADRERWNGRYAAGEYGERRWPSDFLKESLDRLPRGRALDLACGLGRNARFLAENGWQVDAVDVSDVALRKAETLARGPTFDGLLVIWSGVTRRPQTTIWWSIFAM